MNEDSSFALWYEEKQSLANVSQESTIGPVDRSNGNASANSDTALPVPTSERYKISKSVANGGTAAIFRAEDQQLPRAVALKVLRKEYRYCERAINSFTNEAAIIGYLSHPGVPPIYDLGACEDGRPYLAMKFIGGSTLADKMSHNELSPAEKLNIFTSVCQTVAFAHSKGVIHRDLKPANIMVGDFGNVFVMDWGFAKFIGPPPPGIAQFLRIDDSELSVCGTPGYMSPEQAHGEEVDERTDVFGLGSIMFEMLIGHKLNQSYLLAELANWPSCSEMDLAFSELETNDSHFSLIQLARRCLAVDRAGRYGNAIEVASELAFFQATALEQAQGDLKLFFELSLDLFCIANFEGYFKRINSNFTKVLGYSESELLEKPFMDFIHPDDLDRTTQQMSVLFHGKPVVRFRNRYRARCGRYVTMEWTAKALAEDKMIFAVARDVSSPHYG